MEMIRWATEVGRGLGSDGPFVCLIGELGAGKSTLVRAVCEGAGVAGAVLSPTFTLVHRHDRPGGGPLFHADLYRLEDEEQLWDVGWTELASALSPVFVEWPERASAHLPAHRWEIRLRIPSARAERTERRHISIAKVGSPPPLTPLPEA
ncbi:MAG: tRNA (adenosine(37)-N6)-threonylcarbamoyltransferase complex ATPase subunit type 1 TsaE, partial [Gemmatimonadota bacterium]